MYDSVAAIPELFCSEEPTELPRLAELLELMQPRIDLILHSEWKCRVPATDNEF